MLQTSITGWLKKPKIIDVPPRATAEPSQSSKAHTQSTLAKIALPPFRTTTSPTKHSRADHKTSSDTQNTHSNLRPLPSNVILAPLTPTTLLAFKRLNALLLPIAYPPKFYDEILSDPHTSALTLIALWQHEQSIPTTTTTTAAATKQPTLIAGIRCRLYHPSPLDDLPATKPVLYVATLGTLAPYRNLGLASHLLAAVTARAVAEYGVGAVVVHVWEANEEGREWYAKQGFVVEKREEGYYRKLKPGTALVMRRDVRVADLVGRAEV